MAYTTIEQSKRLIGIGLDPETADATNHDTPAWTLDRLTESCCRRNSTTCRHVPTTTSSTSSGASGEAIVKGRYTSDEQEAFRRHYDEPDQYGHYRGEEK